ncbi:MAG: 16S rRNA (guanine(527)-N(7))-methyltransferase RsmG [Sporolactobacillus sp.]
MDTLIQLLQEKGISLNEKQSQQFDTYYQLLMEWNKRVNLTAIIEKKEVMIKHFYDSLTAAFFVTFKEGQTLCDVGSGAGFPGIPLKILYPGLRLTIVDSLRKRLDFLDEVKNQLRLEDVSLYHDRAETFAHRPEMREKFDWVTARAVANLTVLVEYCLPLVRLDGTFIALKGSHAGAEAVEAKQAIHKLGGLIDQQIDLTLPEENGQRSIILIKKEQWTPEKYPRKPGTPLRKPLK